MNTGLFYSLDIDASKLDDGIAVFRYTDLPAYINQKHPISQQYPIAVVITEEKVRFIVHYCVYRSGHDQYHFFYEDYQEEGEVDHLTIMHMEEVLFDLPYVSKNGEIASIIKNLYTTRFPITLGQESNTRQNSFANYMQYLLSQRYEDEGFLQQYVERDRENTSYSSLLIWGLKNAERRFCLREIDSTIGSACNYDKFLRKLFLDFLFDLIHSHVFENSPYYTAMYEGLMADFFFSAVVHKSEYYYQRALVCERFGGLCDSQEYNAIHRIYAEYFDKAEKNWLECIQSPEADRYFNYTPNWYQIDNGRSNNEGCNVEIHTRMRRVWARFSLKKIERLLFPRFHVRPYSWFVDPEEELQRVYFYLPLYNEKNTPNQCGLLWPFRNSQDFAVLKEGKAHPEELNLRLKKSSLWLFKRYAFANAFRLSFFRGANTLLFIILSTISILLLVFPGFLKPTIIFYISVYIGVIAFVVTIILGVCWRLNSHKITKEKADQENNKQEFCVDRNTTTGSILKKQILSSWQKRWFWRSLAMTLIYWMIWSALYYTLPWLIFCIIVIILIFLSRDSLLSRYLHFSFPRLIASITAAWFTIALSEDLYKAFFDASFTWRTCALVSGIVFVFVLYEINRMLPFLDSLKRVFRASELMLISFILSICIGLVVINFTGEKFLERSGYLPEFFRHELLTGPGKSNSLQIAWDEISPDTMVQYSLRNPIPRYADSIVHARKMASAIRAFIAAKQRDHDLDYSDRIDMLREDLRDSIIQDSTAQIDSAEWRSFILKHENPTLFLSLLENVQHRDHLWKGRHTIATNWEIGKSYNFFILRDFLIQFSFIAMFIGIFIQLIFEEKNIPES